MPILDETICGCDPARNWQIDFPHENGHYVNTCVVCREAFLGHKQRRMCRKCVSDIEAARNKGAK